MDGVMNVSLDSTSIDELLFGDLTIGCDAYTGGRYF